MKKWMKILMSCGMVFTLWACTAKTEVSLSQVSFKSFYVGDSTNPAESYKTPLSSTESNQVEELLDIAHWVSVAPDKEALEPVGLMMYDTDGRVYEIFQVIDTFVIKVKEGHSSPVYFESKGNISTLIEGWFKPFKTTQEIKTVLSHAIPLKVDANISLNSERTKFDLTSTQAESLMSLLKIETWDAIVLPVTDDSPEAVFSITLTEDGDTLLFSPWETEAMVNYLQIVDGESQMFSYRILLSDYRTVQTTLNQWRAEVDPFENPQPSAFVFTQVEFPMPSVPERILKPVYYPITQAESDQAKLSLNIDQWQLQSTNPAISWVTMNLTDDKGMIFTLGYTQSGFVVQITDPLAPSFILTYTLPENPVEITMAFLPYWEAAQATAAMMDFMPVELGINSMSGENGSIRSVNLCASEAKSIVDLLKMETWRVDPEPDKYAFGWEASYILNDGKGSTFSIYSYFTHDLMAVVVRDPQTKEGEWVWYVTSNTIFTDLAAYIKAHYPNP